MREHVAVPQVAVTDIAGLTDWNTSLAVRLLVLRWPPADSAGGDHCAEDGDTTSDIAAANLFRRTART